jgi:Resolvase, N terminal domain
MRTGCPQRRTSAFAAVDIPVQAVAMATNSGKLIAYYRVSTGRQGKSGLGLDAQRTAVATYLNGGDWTIVAEFTEVESGKNSDRPAIRTRQGPYLRRRCPRRSRPLQHCAAI